MDRVPKPGLKFWAPARTVVTEAQIHVKSFTNVIDIPKLYLYLCLINSKNVARKSQLV